MINGWINYYCIVNVKSFAEDLDGWIRRKLRKQIADGAITALKNYNWSGNVLQLKNEIQRAVIMADERIEAAHFSFTANSAVKPCAAAELSEGFNLENHLHAIEKSFYEAAIQKSGNNRAEAARLLGLSYRIFSYNLDKISGE